MIWTDEDLGIAASAGVATPDGRLPITDVFELQRALLASSRVQDDAESLMLVTHCMRRGRDLGLTAATVRGLARRAVRGLNYVWDPANHPRDRLGRFVEVGGLARVYDERGQHVATGRVSRFTPDSVTVESVSDGRSVTVPKARIEQIDVRANIPSAAPSTKTAPSVPGQDDSGWIRIKTSDLSNYQKVRGRGYRVRFNVADNPVFFVGPDGEERATAGVIGRQSSGLVLDSYVQSGSGYQLKTELHFEDGSVATIYGTGTTLGLYDPDVAQAVSGLDVDQALRDVATAGQRLPERLDAIGGVERPAYEGDSEYIRLTRRAEQYEAQQAASAWMAALGDPDIRDKPKMIRRPPGMSDQAWLYAQHLANVRRPTVDRKTVPFDYTSHSAAVLMARDQAQMAREAREKAERVKERIGDAPGRIVADTDEWGGPGAAARDHYAALQGMGAVVERAVDARMAALFGSEFETPVTFEELEAQRALYDEFVELKHDLIKSRIGDWAVERMRANNPDDLRFTTAIDPDFAVMLAMNDYPDEAWERLGPDFKQWIDDTQTSLLPRRSETPRIQARHFQARREAYRDVLQQMGVQFGAPDDVVAPYWWKKRGDNGVPKSGDTVVLKQGRLRPEGWPEDSPFATFVAFISGKSVMRTADGREFETSWGPGDLLPVITLDDIRAGHGTKEQQSHGRQLLDAIEWMPTDVLRANWGPVTRPHRKERYSRYRIAGVEVSQVGRAHRGSDHLGLSEWERGTYSTALHEEHHGVEWHNPWVGRMEWVGLTHASATHDGTRWKRKPGADLHSRTHVSGDKRESRGIRDDLYTHYAGRTYTADGWGERDYPGAGAVGMYGSDEPALFEFLTMTAEAVLGDRIDDAHGTESTRRRNRENRSWYLGTVLALAGRHRVAEPDPLPEPDRDTTPNPATVPVRDRYASYGELQARTGSSKIDTLRKAAKDRGLDAEVFMSMDANGTRSITLVAVGNPSTSGAPTTTLQVSWLWPQKPGVVPKMEYATLDDGTVSTRLTAGALADAVDSLGGAL